MSQLANYVNFVGVGDGITDDSAAFQAAINTAAALPNGGTVFVPPPSVAYVIDNIVLKSQVDIVGSSMRATQFLAKSGSTNSVFVLDAGHVINCRYQNFFVNANGNANQHCFHLQATSGSSGDGGLWWAIFKNVYVNNFGGYAWWLRGGPNSFTTPHQWITFDSCIGIRANNTFSRCMLMTGQVGQVTFQGECDFDCIASTLTGVAIELGSETFNSGAPAGQQLGGPLVGGAVSYAGPRTPYNIIFRNLTIQDALMGIYTFNTFNVIVEACYVENVAQCITGSVAVNLAVLNCHFTNSGILSGSGYIFSGTNGTSGSIVGCDYGGPDRFISNGSGNGGGQIYTRNNVSFSPASNLDANVTKAVNGFTASTVQLGYAFQAFINTTDVITTIASNHSVGARVSFVNNQGGPSGVMSATGGNIKLGTKTTLTLGNLDTAFFELSEITGGWQLLGTTGALS